jgi:hypothetical protein
MVDRVPEEGPDHGIVRAERRESLAQAEGEPPVAVRGAKQVLTAQHQLMQVGMRVAPVDEPFARDAGGQLALPHRRAFEVEHPGEPEAAQGAGMEVEGRLHHAQLGQGIAAGHRVGILQGDDGLRAEPDPGSLLGASGEGSHPSQGGEREPAPRPPTQAESATAARTGVSAARR